MCNIVIISCIVYLHNSITILVAFNNNNNYVCVCVECVYVCSCF